MLVPLRFQSPSSRPPEDPFSLLLECHQRIRTFLALGQRLAGAGDAPHREVAEAAGRVERYFTVGLPKHVADEDLSLAPRLRELALSADVLAALEKMEQQHRELEALLERLVPRWQKLQANPERLASLAPALALDSEQLAIKMEQHLLLEERVLFPVAGAQLPEESVVALAAEMRARRGMAP
ncbi:MAG: hemerythrin domain-containing protein [Myxococcaceae bacterium]|nr:hemerythrin domain-containing protein [Myxococcaceae bacterium]MCI0669919.1 hemerythrin domain-containing protein [Myxococcaceae bacterium]